MGTLLSKFEKKIKSMAAAAVKFATGARNEGQPIWENLADNVEAPGPDMFLNSYRDDFDRTELVNRYNTELYGHVSTTSSDRTATLIDIQLLRIQSDWMMTVERDFLMRRNSRIRTEAHAVAIKKTVGDDKGPVLAGVYRMAQGLLEIAGNKFYYVKPKNG